MGLFRHRYTSTTPTSRDRTGKTWNGVRYYRTSGAPCAVPGTSNHGWGLAIDLAIDADGDEQFEWPPKSLNSTALAWLRANAPRYGFSWEGTPGTSSFETWHLRYVTGDRVPQAVLDHEAASAIDWPAIIAFVDGCKATTLRNGSNGPCVKLLQQRLTDLGFKPGPLDGAFGPKTDAAVRLFQKSRSLKVDGIVGPTTWSHMF